MTRPEDEKRFSEKLQMVCLQESKYGEALKFVLFTGSSSKGECLEKIKITEQLQVRRLGKEVLRSYFSTVYEKSINLYKYLKKMYVPTNF